MRLDITGFLVFLIYKGEFQSAVVEGVLTIVTFFSRMIFVNFKVVNYRKIYKELLS